MKYPLGRFPQFPHQARASQKRRERAAATQALKKYNRIRSERDQLVRLAEGWTWMRSRLQGKKATPAIQNEVTGLEKTLQRMMDNWNETKYYRKRLDLMNQRIGALGVHYGLLADLQRFIDSLPISPD